MGLSTTQHDPGLDNVIQLLRSIRRLKSEGWKHTVHCQLQSVSLYNIQLSTIELKSWRTPSPKSRLTNYCKSYFHEDRSVPSMRVGQGRSTQAVDGTKADSIVYSIYSHVFAYTYMLLHHICMGTQGLARTIFNIIHPCQGSFCRTSLVSFLAKSWILSVSKLWHFVPRQKAAKLIISNTGSFSRLLQIIAKSRTWSDAWLVAQGRRGGWGSRQQPLDLTPWKLWGVLLIRHSKECAISIYQSSISDIWQCDRGWSWSIFIIYLYNHNLTTSVLEGYAWLQRDTMFQHVL